MRISEEQVEAAESRAGTAEAERDAVARELELSPYSDLVAGRHTEASRTAAQLRANARELRAAFVAQVAEEKRRASRPELEKAAAVEIAAARAEVSELHEGFVEALAEAQAALVGLVAAAGAWNAAVGSHTDVLAAAGLDLRGGETGAERTALGEARLKVDGRMFEPVNEGAVAAWVVRRVVESRVSDRHHLLGALNGAAITVEQNVPTVVDRVPAPGRVERSRRYGLADAYRKVRGGK
ncbi:hypothetical protein ACWD0Z_06045 [Streptomyces sp. NPDC003007]